MSTVLHPESISDTRKDLTRTVDRFRTEGAKSTPVVFGRRRRAEAVVMPYEAYEALLEIVEDVAIARRVQERDHRDSGRCTSAEQVARNFGLDYDQL